MFRFVRNESVGIRSPWAAGLSGVRGWVVVVTRDM